MRLFKLKPVINIKNNQINLTLPRKKLSEKLLKDLDSNKVKKLKLKLEGWENE